MCIKGTCLQRNYTKIIIFLKLVKLQEAVFLSNRICLTEQSLYNAMFGVHRYGLCYITLGSIGMDYVILLCYKGTFLQRNYRKTTIFSKIGQRIRGCISA